MIRLLSLLIPSLFLFQGGFARASGNDFGLEDGKRIAIQKILAQDGSARIAFSVCEEATGACDGPFDSISEEEYREVLRILEDAKSSWHWKYTGAIGVAIGTLIVTAASQAWPVLFVLGWSYSLYTDGEKALVEENQAVNEKIRGFEPGVPVAVQGARAQWVQAIRLLNQEARDSLRR